MTAWGAWRRERVDLVSVAGFVRGHHGDRAVKFVMKSGVVFSERVEVEPASGRGPSPHAFSALLQRPEDSQALTGI
jgi:hypothetical protein